MFAHGGKQAGSDVFLQVFHDGQCAGEVNGAVAAGSTVGHPSVRFAFAFCKSLQLAKELAAFHRVMISNSSVRYQVGCVANPEIIKWDGSSSVSLDCIESEFAAGEFNAFRGGWRIVSNRLPGN